MPTETKVSVTKCWNKAGGKSYPDSWNYSFDNFLAEPFAGANVTCSSSKTGVPVRNYKRLIARGSNATSAFSGTLQEMRTQESYGFVKGWSLPNPFPWYQSHFASGGRWSNGITSLPALPNSSNVSIATDIAATKFYKQVQDIMTAFQGGVFLAELRETLHMIRNPAKSLRDSVRRYIDHLGKHRGRQLRRTPSNRLKFLSDSWLEYSFGWSPLLNDLDQARNVLDKRQNQLMQELIPVKAVGTSNSTYFDLVNTSSSTIDALFRRRAINETIKVYAGAVSSKASGTTLLNMSALGLSPRAFVPTLWEAMPYSFLIDYFTNIGDVLEAWSNQYVALAWGRETTIRSSTMDSQVVYLKRSAGVAGKVQTELFLPGSTTARNKNVSRTVLTYVPVPGFHFELPGFGRKWINLSALATARRSLRFR